jgi:hypothetical protein
MKRLTDGVPRIYKEGVIYPPNQIPLEHLAACNSGWVWNITPKKESE